MINLLGTKIVMTIIMMLVLLGGAGSGFYYYIAPGQEQVERDQRTVDGKIRVKRDEIRRLKVEYDQLKDQIVKFNILKKKGFFNAQDRVTAREMFNQLSEQANVNGEIELKAADQMDDPSARDAKHVLISGPMTIKANALLDQNIFKYMVALQNIWPGYLEFKSFDFHRKQDDINKTFTELATGKIESLIEGQLEFTWWSMASPSQMEANPYFNPTAVAPVVLPTDGNTPTPLPPGVTP